MTATLLHRRAGRLIFGASLCVAAAGACAPRVVSVGAALPPAVTPAAPTDSPGAAPLPAERFLSHIAVLAHDDLGGRGIGSDGIDLAAGYIAGQFAAAGLVPGGPDGSYFQRFTVDRSSIWKGMLRFAGKAGQGDAAEPLVARNVLGLLPGMGPHAGEYVVIGAHYDHLGTRGKRIYNGADDNASGTAGVIEIARKLACAGYRDRSVVFAAFAAEELGLHGSAHYVAHPAAEMASTVAMLNLDMIGRLTPEDEANMLAVHGLGTGDSFRRIVERRAAGRGVRFIPEESALGPSDHSSFYRAGVPALFFFTGIHGDYHRPSDDIDTVNAAGGAEVAALAHDIALEIINGDLAPGYVEVDRPARIFRGSTPPGPRAVLGIVPDPDDDPDEPGCRVRHVVAGGGADRAGIRPDDRVISIAERLIEDLEDFAAALSDQKNAGDVVRVVVRRAETELVLDVALTAPGEE